MVFDLSIDSTRIGLHLTACILIIVNFYVIVMSPSCLETEFSLLFRLISFPIL